MLNFNPMSVCWDPEDIERLRDGLPKYVDHIVGPLKQHGFGDEYTVPMFIFDIVLKMRKLGNYGETIQWHQLRYADMDYVDFAIQLFGDR